MPRYALTESTKNLTEKGVPYERVQVQKYNMSENDIRYHVQVLRWNKEGKGRYEALYTIDSKEFNFEDNSDKARESSE